MRTRVGVAFGIAVICAVIVMGVWTGPNAPKCELVKYLSHDVPVSVIIIGSKSFKLQKDLELFWILAHPPHQLDALLDRQFRLCDGADKQFIQQSLKDAFPEKFIPNPNDSVYRRDDTEFDVFLLTEDQRTNSFVMVLKK